MKNLLISFMMIGYIALANAQTCTPFTQTMFYQDFENPTSSTLNETVNSGQTAISYYNASGYSIGARSRAISNNLVDVDYGPVNASFATNVKISFSFAPINIDDNPNDYLSISIYTGSSWSKEIIIQNSSKVRDLTYDFSSTLENSFSFKGKNQPSTLYISNTNKVNKIEISFPNSGVDLNQLKIKFQGKNNIKSKYWIIDDIKITGDFIDTKTWDGTSWTGRTTSAPSDKEIVVINGNYSTKNNGNINACECTVNANQTLLLNADTNITIKNNIINNGSIIVENDANLIQLNDNATFTGNPITVYKDTKLKKSEYNYWSSPVENQNLLSFSPSTLTNRFYTYNESNDSFANVTPSTNSFIPAKGYAIRAPNNFGTNSSVFKGVFNGKPNNGVKAIEIYKNGNGHNLVGNPYPSNISFAKFYAANSTKIEPKAYFWTNTNPNPPQQGSNYNGANYAVRNLTDGIPAQNQNITEKPTDEIVVGQGFIITKLNPGTENIVFNNSMRTTNKGKFSNARIATTEDSKIWLQLLTPAKNFNTILIGYVNGATNAIDTGYDASPISKTSDMFYTIADNQNLVIQGRSNNFSTEDKVQIGAVYFEPGTYEISISQTEGIFNGAQQVYLKDNLLNKTINLSEGAYSFYSEAGETNNRFEIVYKPESTLAVDNNISKNKETLIYKNAELITIENKLSKITSVQVFDATGKLITNAKPNSNLFSIESAKIQKGLVLFKITTHNKTEVKKFLVK